MPSRRQFLRVGAASAAVLVATRWLHPSFAAPLGGFRVLDASSAGMVAALVPVVLADALPMDHARAARIRETVEAFDRAVAALSPAVRGEIEQLFSFLSFAPARLAMTGLWQPLERSSPEDIAAFLSRWRRSAFDLQRAAYQALTQLIQAAWYDNPGAWAAIGYPGPPKLP
jgi:hypothetical protein